MKIKFLRTSTVGGKPYKVGEIAEINKDSASILIRKGRATEVQGKSKTANSNKED